MSTMQPPPNHRSTWSHHVNPHHHVNTDTDYNMQMHMQSHSYAAHVPLQRPGLSQQMTYHASAGPSFPSGPSFGHDIKLAPLALPSTPSRGQSPASIHSQSLRGPMAVGGSRTAPRRESPELKATPISPAGSGRDMIASGSPDNAAGGRLMNVLMKKMEEKGQDSKPTETENVSYWPTVYTGLLAYCVLTARSVRHSTQRRGRRRPLYARLRAVATDVPSRASSKLT